MWSRDSALGQGAKDTGATAKIESTEDAALEPDPIRDAVKTRDARESANQGRSAQTRARRRQKDVCVCVGENWLETFSSYL